MPSKTNSDLIRELDNKVTYLTGQNEALSRKMELLEARIYQMSDKMLEVQQTMLEKISELQQDIAVLKDFKTRNEEFGRRSWLIVAASVGSLLTLAGNQILFFMRN